MGETAGEEQEKQAETCAFEDCSEGRWERCEKGFCIYHSPQNGEDEDVARAVWDEARKRAEAGKSDFRGWHFPDDPKKKHFSGKTFTADAFFIGATFTEVAGFDGATFRRRAWFDRAMFKGRAQFDRTMYKEGAQFYRAMFKGGASFGAATFTVDAYFARATFTWEVWFDGATFTGEVFFDQATLKRRAWFDGATFTGTAWFNGATFEGYASFATAKASGGTDIHFDLPSWRWGRGTVGAEEEDAPKGGLRRLAGLTRKLLPERVPFRRRYQGEMAYRFAKQCAQARGDYAMYGEYHYAEQCAIEDGKWRNSIRKPRPLAPLRWCGCLLRLLLVRCLFGYGEKPIRVLVAALLVIGVFAGIYAGYDAVAAPPGTDSVGRWAPVYFSIVTFTTLGYGDLRPKEDFRLLAGAEAMIGAALMALFIVALARKYTR